MPQYKDIPVNSKCCSQVAGEGDNTMCVTVGELVECGVSEGYLKRTLFRQRTREVNCWPHHKEGNTVYIHYDGLKDKYKTFINSILCGGVDAHVWVRNHESEKLQRKLESVYRKLPEMVEVCSTDITELENRGCYSGTEVQRAARTAGWLRLWLKLDVKTARKIGFSTIGELRGEMFKRCLFEQEKGFLRFPKKVNNLRVLDRKAREFKVRGIDCLVSRLIGNQNRCKMNTQVHAVLVDLASAPVKYSFEDIGLVYNTQYPELPRLTVSSIKQHLNKPEVRKVWYYMRHGKSSGDAAYQPLVLRESVSHPDYLWSIDGTPTQLYFRDGNGKIRSDMYLYFVTDVCSGSIIGSSIALTETASLVTSALQDAVYKKRHIPQQLQYDRGSANVSEAVKGLMNNMSRVHFACQAELPRAKYVEEIIGHFQQQVLRQCINFKGGNVNVKSLNSRANPDLMKWLKKHPEELPTQGEVIDQVFEMIEAWNNRGQKRDNYGLWVGESKMDMYNKDYEGRKTLSYAEISSLFMVELPKPRAYKQQGIKIVVDGKPHYYVVPDPDNTANDFIFANTNMGREFNVRMNLDNTDFIVLYNKDGVRIETAFEKERFKACVADMVDGDSTKIKQFIKSQKEYGYDYALKELEKQINIIKDCGMEAVGAGRYFATKTNHKSDESFDWRDATKSEFNEKERIQEDYINGIADKQQAITDPALLMLLNS